MLGPTHSSAWPSSLVRAANRQLLENNQHALTYLTDLVRHLGYSSLPTSSWKMLPPHSGSTRVTTAGGPEHPLYTLAQAVSAVPGTPAPACLSLAHRGHDDLDILQPTVLTQRDDCTTDLMSRVSWRSC